MDLWKNRVIPKFKTLLGGKKLASAAAEACKSFDQSKLEISKEVEERKDELKPNVIKIYEESSTEIKALIKEPSEVGLKKHSTKVHKFLEDLVSVDFPGSKAVCDATKLYGVALVSGPVTFVLEKISALIVSEEKPTMTTSSREVEVTTAPAQTATTEVEPKDTVVQKAAVPESEKAAAPADPPAKDTPTKVEQQKPEAEETPKAK